jgi:heat shock protein HspQ
MKCLFASSRYINFVFPAGNYVVTDPCYICDDDEWSEICTMISPTEDQSFTDLVLEIEGMKMIMFSTAFGDGEYDVELHTHLPNTAKILNKCRAFVDSGMLAVIPEELFKNKFKYNFEQPHVHLSEDFMVQFGPLGVIKLFDFKNDKSIVSMDTENLNDNEDIQNKE